MISINMKPLKGRKLMVLSMLSVGAVCFYCLYLIANPMDNYIKGCFGIPQAGVKSLAVVGTSSLRAYRQDSEDDVNKSDVIKSNVLAELQKLMVETAEDFPTVAKPNEVHKVILQFLNESITRSNYTSDKDIVKGSGSIFQVSEDAWKNLQAAINKLDTPEEKHALMVEEIKSGLREAVVNLLEELTNKTLRMIVDEQFKHWGNGNEEKLDLIRKIQVIIVTTWRSGSTFLGELLASSPGVFTHYEPLLAYGIRQVRDNAAARDSLRMISKLLHCEYHSLSRYIHNAQQYPEMISRNTRLWKACHSREYPVSICYSPVFLQHMCSLYPYQVMKVVRLRLREFKSLLEDPSLNVHVIYLVRDPRATISSRKYSVNWCDSRECNDPSILCTDLKEDYEAALQLMKKFSQQFTVLRYEDLSREPYNVSKHLFKKIGLPFHPNVAQYIESHTNDNIDTPWSTKRKSYKQLTRWKEKLLWKDIVHIQKVCKTIISEFGYKLLNNETDLNSQDILLPLSYEYKLY